MEPDVEVEQVRKDVPRDAPNRVLRNVGEHGVPELGEESCSDSCESVCAISASSKLRGGGEDAQPTMTVPAIAKTPSEVVGSTTMFNVSTIPLKKKGTWTFKIYPVQHISSAPHPAQEARTLPPTSNPSAMSTLVLVPQSSFGQMLGNSVLTISQSLPLCSLSATSATFKTSLAPSCGALCAPSGPECC